jgi:hypothetical protein
VVGRFKEVGGMRLLAGPDEINSDVGTAWMRRHGLVGQVRWKVGALLASESV